MRPMSYDMIATESATAGTFVHLAAGASNAELLDLALMHCWARRFDADEIMHMINVHANNGKGQNAYDISWNNGAVRECLKKHGGQPTPKLGEGGSRGYAAGPGWQSWSFNQTWERGRWKQ